MLSVPVAVAAIVSPVLASQHDLVLWSHQAAGPRTSRAVSCGQRRTCPRRKRKKSERFSPGSGSIQEPPLGGRGCRSFFDESRDSCSPWSFVELLAGLLVPLLLASRVRSPVPSLGVRIDMPVGTGDLELGQEVPVGC